MKITKFKHACLVLEIDGASLVIDPGEWNNDFVVPETVAGIVVTHEHADHFDVQRLRSIIEKHPDIYIYAHEDIIAQLNGLPGKTVAVGETAQVGPFALRFTGGDHAVIHPDYAAPANLGVVINDGELYYPGDSFALPDCDVETLAAPASAPWLKVSEAMDFIAAVKPNRVFPTHNAVLSAEGHAVTNAWLEKSALACGADFEVLDA